MARAGLALVSLLGLGWVVLAAGGVEADPKKEYRLGPKEGPYMILIASFHGDDDDESTSAYGEARKLVYELRNRYHFEAYMFNRTEQEKAARDKQLQEMHARLGEDQRIKKIRIVDEWAVVIGSWPTRDAATDFLYGTIKERPARDKSPNERTVPKAKLPPPESVRKTSLFTVAKGGTKARTDDGKEVSVHTGDENPFSRAWVVRNPLAGSDVLVAGQVEQEIAAKLNSYSLKNCPKTHTLVVSEFYYMVPDTAKKPGFVDRINPFTSDKDAKLVLDRPTAAKAAVLFADGLRMRNLGHEVYLWPTNNRILVTVGGFNISPTQASADNSQFYALRNKLVGAKIGDVQVLETMYPMLVPRD